MPFQSHKTIRAIFFCLLSGLLIPLHAAAQEKPVGKIISIRGTVEILVSEPVAEVKKGEVKKVAAEVWQKITKKQPVYAKDTFRTGRKSRLKILFEDKSLMALGPRTKMSVESYLFKPEDKLRQGVINVAHGLSMYIVNKSQKNKKSSFRIVSPTGNLAARGTQGYISATKDKTLIANQAGTVEVSNSDPNVGLEQKSNWDGQEPVFTTAGYEEIDFFAQGPGAFGMPMGPMTKSTILQGLPPTPPVPLTLAELTVIRNVVLARIGVTPGDRALVKVDEPKTKTKKKEKKDKGDKSEGGTAGGTEGGTTGGTGSGTTVARGGGDVGGDAGGGDLDIAGDFMSDFVEGVVPAESFGTSEDFAGGVDVFDDSGTDACTP